MSLFQNLLDAWRLPFRYTRTITLTTPSHMGLIEEIRPLLESLLREDPTGHAYRHSIEHWSWMPHPPLEIFSGRASTCRIYGPRQWTDLGQERPLCGWVCAPSAVIDLTATEAYALQQALKDAIDATLIQWVEDNSAAHAQASEQKPHAVSTQGDQA